MQSPHRTSPRSRFLRLQRADGSPEESTFVESYTSSHPLLPCMEDISRSFSRNDGIFHGDVNSESAVCPANSPPCRYKIRKKNKVSSKPAPTTFLEQADEDTHVDKYPCESNVPTEKKTDCEPRAKSSSRRIKNKRMSVSSNNTLYLDSGICTECESSLADETSTLKRFGEQPVPYHSEFCAGLIDDSTLCLYAQPTQPIAQDPLMPLLPPPDTMTQLEEVCRRLKEIKLGHSKTSRCTKNTVRNPRSYGSQLSGIQEESTDARKRVHKYNTFLPSLSDASPPTSISVDDGYTIVGYYFCGGDAPYKTRLAGTNITLRQFKTLFRHKKENFRFFFKTDSHDAAKEPAKIEISDDNEVLPLWDGKIFCFIESVK